MLLVFKEIILLSKSIFTFCRGRDSVYAFGTPSEIIFKQSTLVDILNYSRRRTGSKFNYFLIYLDNIYLIFLLDKLSLILTKLKKRPLITIRSTCEPYLKNKLVSRLSLGKKNLVRNNYTQIYTPIFASAISLDSENPKEMPKRFLVDITKDDLHKRRTFDKNINQISPTGVIFSGVIYPKRESLVNALENIIPVERLGPAYNKPFNKPKSYLSKKHLFCICPENSIREGYCSEKVIEAYFSGYIPIYWNHPRNVKGILNPLAYINLYGLTNTQIENKIKLLLRDNELVKRMFEEPLFDEGFDIENVMQNFDLQLVEWIKTYT